MLRAGTEGGGLNRAEPRVFIWRSNFCFGILCRVQVLGVHTLGL